MQVGFVRTTEAARPSHDLLGMALFYLLQKNSVAGRILSHTPTVYVRANSTSCGDIWGFVSGVLS